MAAHVYHWKHGWIPLDHVALDHGGHKSQATGSLRGRTPSHKQTGIKSRRHVAHAALTLHQVPPGPDRAQAAAQIKAAAAQHGASDLLPKTPVTSTDHGVKPGDVAAFAGGSAEAHLVKAPDGSMHFTPERQALHRKIIDSMLAGKTPVSHPAFNVMGGGPASGKSSMERKTPALSDNSAVINPDEVKALLPEYKAQTGSKDPNVVKGAAGYAHEESSYVAKLATAEGFRRRINLTLDGTGDSSADNLRGKLHAAREHGYAVNGYYVTIPTEEAVHRAELRGQKSGRFVDPTVIRNTHENVSRTLPEVMGEFDTLKVYDNTTTLKLIAQKDPGGKPQIVDKALWGEFVAKAKPGGAPHHNPARNAPPPAPGTAAKNAPPPPGGAKVRVAATTYRGEAGHSITGTTRDGKRVKVFVPGDRAAADKAAASIRAGGSAFGTPPPAKPSAVGTRTLEDRVRGATDAQLLALANRPNTDPNYRAMLLKELRRRGVRT